MPELNPPTRVAIIGAGFGGISACKALAKSKKVVVHLVDRRNHHLFQPLLYQVAMAGLNPSDIAVPIRKLFSRNKNVNITLAEVDNVDVENCRIHFDDSWHQYDYIIIASGAKHFYFGQNQWEVIAPGLKTIEQATEIRRRILTAFEMAEKQDNYQQQKKYLTFAVVGGGPTGVELAGAISELAAHTLIKDYKRADLSSTRVILIEAGSRLLAAFPEKLSQKAESNLKNMGVEVYKNTQASQLSSSGLQIGDQWLDCHTIIWAAGVKPSSLTEKIESEKDAQGRLLVAPDLSLPNHPNVFAVGDLCSFKNKIGVFLPGIAPVAIQQGVFVGELICNEIRGKKRSDFQYWDKGIMATIGRSKAVVHSGKLQLSGFPAWIIWVFIHIVYLMRFRNKMSVFLQWVWSYFRFGRGARLIVQKSWRFYGGKKINYENTETES